MKRKNAIILAAALILSVGTVGIGVQKKKDKDKLKDKIENILIPNAEKEIEDLGKSSAMLKDSVSHYEKLDDIFLEIELFNSLESFSKKYGNFDKKAYTEYKDVITRQHVVYGTPEPYTKIGSERIRVGLENLDDAFVRLIEYDEMGYESERLKSYNSVESVDLLIMLIDGNLQSNMDFKTPEFNKDLKEIKQMLTEYKQHLSNDKKLEDFKTQSVKKDKQLNNASKKLNNLKDINLKYKSMLDNNKVKTKLKQLEK